ncbi:unnamed protein product [Allacma fusca]|uniref:Uncharacterized protein n=1 Tax=Allacma fusca TaxID=39272 RepID=A0A8J2LG64_9HEXA|nr:unnamed protein product [Allacma fusca]
MEVPGRSDMVLRNSDSNYVFRSGKFYNGSPAQEKARKGSSWFQFWNIAFSFGSRLFLIPYSFWYDSDTQIFRLESSKFQKFIWLMMQSTGLILTRVRVLDGWESFKHSDAPLRYFNFVGFLVVVFCFDTTFKCVLWGNQQKLKEFLNELQHSPLLEISSKRSLKIKFVLGFSISYLILSFFYFCFAYGIDSFDLKPFHEAVRNQAMATFSLDDSWDASPLFPFLMAGSFIINQYQASFCHFNDVYVLSSIFLMYTIAKDFTKALKTDRQSCSQVLGLMRSYRSLISKFNTSMGLATCVYSLYFTPYYATHLIDMLNRSDFLNRFSMSVYLGFLALGLTAAVKINTMAIQMKRWLSLEERYTKNVEIQALSIFLNDLKTKKFALGSFYVIHNGLTGQIVNLILTLAIITIQMNMSG